MLNKKHTRGFGQNLLDPSDDCVTERKPKALFGGKLFEIQQRPVGHYETCWVRPRITIFNAFEGLGLTQGLTPFEPLLRPSHWSAWANGLSRLPREEPVFPLTPLAICRLSGRATRPAKVKLENFSNFEIVRPPPPRPWVAQNAPGAIVARVTPE